MLTNFPEIDAHFWVIRDGKVIDPSFSQYKMIERMWDCDTNNKDYLPAPEITQKIMIEQHYRVLKTRFNTDDIKVAIEKFSIGSRKRGIVSPRYACCFQNAILEIAINGGELVFGSLGFKKNKTEGFHYEWGGEHYKTIGDFRGTSNMVEKMKEGLRGTCNMETALEIIKSRVTF